MVIILRPIDDVIAYVVNAHYWRKWGMDLVNAVNVGPNVIGAEYFDLFHRPGFTKFVTWHISYRDQDGYVAVVFTDSSGEKSPVEYRFMPIGDGTQTYVTRIPDDSDPSWPLAGWVAKLKLLVETGRVGFSDPESGSVTSHGPP